MKTHIVVIDNKTYLIKSCWKNGMLISHSCYCLDNNSLSPRT